MVKELTAKQYKEAENWALGMMSKEELIAYIKALKKEMVKEKQKLKEVEKVIASQGGAG